MLKKVFNKSDNIYNKLIYSVLFTLICQIILIILASYIITSSEKFYNSLNIFWFLITAISSLLSGLISGRIFKNRGILWGSINGLIDVFITVILLLCFSGLKISSDIFILIPCGLLPGAIGGIVSSNLK